MTKQERFLWELKREIEGMVGGSLEWQEQVKHLVNKHAKKESVVIDISNELDI